MRGGWTIKVQSVSMFRRSGSTPRPAIHAKEAPCGQISVCSLRFLFAGFGVLSVPISRVKAHLLVRRAAGVFAATCLCDVGGRHLCSHLPCRAEQCGRFLRAASRCFCRHGGSVAQGVASCSRDCCRSCLSLLAVLAPPPTCALLVATSQRRTAEVVDPEPVVAGRQESPQQIESEGWH